MNNKPNSANQGRTAGQEDIRYDRYKAIKILYGVPVTDIKPT